MAEMTDLKLIDELLVDLKHQAKMTWEEVENFSSVTHIAMNRLRKAWRAGEMPVITLGLANYFEQKSVREDSMRFDEIPLDDDSIDIPDKLKRGDSMIKKPEELMDDLSRKGGVIVSSGDCSSEEIAVAQACGRFAVNGRCAGFLLRPSKTTSSGHIHGTPDYDEICALFENVPREWLAALLVKLFGECIRRGVLSSRTENKDK